MAEHHDMLDTILVEVGQSGIYQWLLLALYSLAIGLYSPTTIAFAFTAQDLSYRCSIPECDTTPEDFNPPWLRNAIPFSNCEPEKCQRYKYLNGSNTTCYLNNFDPNITETCHTFIYKTAEKWILNDFQNLHCNENLWKLTLVGTINSVGQAIGLPISGYISDKYGRKTLLIWAMSLCGTAGIIKAFTTSYAFFVVMEFIEAAFGAGAYSCAFILSVELVGPKKRVLAAVIVCCTYALGEMFAGAVAWAFQSWRPFILTIYSLNLLVLLYYWITPESLRWLLANNRIKETQQILMKTARINGKTISENTLTRLSNYNEDETKSEVFPIWEYFTDPNLIMRFANCCFCWITTVFLYYGLTLSSVSLVGNTYLDFILTSFIEIPSYFVTWLVIDRIGRRIYMFLSFVLTSLACISFIFVPPDMYWLQLTTYLLGKFWATVAFTTCYIVSTEIFPTRLRNSLIAASSMFGRIGALTAPQMPLLEKVWKPLPLTLYAAMSTLASVFCLFFPETTNKKLPDTVKEAEDVGKIGQRLIKNDQNSSE